LDPVAPSSLASESLTDCYPANSLSSECTFQENSWICWGLDEWIT